MKAFTGAGFPLAVLLSLGALTLWLKHAAELPEEKKVDKRRHDADTIIERFTASTLDPLGRPLHQLTAERLVHYPDDDSSELTLPSLRYTPFGQPVTTMEAKHGKTRGGRDEITLFDEVRVVRQSTKGEPGWLVTMPDITAYPPLGTAHTPSAVVFSQGAAKLDGIGFSLDQNAKTVRLESTIRGHFPPRITNTP